jgi:hypothetical protein
MLTKITDLLWINLDRITLMGLYPHEAHATVRLLDDDKDYYLAKDDFVRLINIYDEYKSKLQAVNVALNMAESVYRVKK